MSAYYNEIDPFAADWLRELIRDGHIAPGEVDTRSIEDVAPSDIAGFKQGKQKYEEQQQSAKAEGERDADMPCGRGMACGLADAMSAGWPSRGADAGNGQTAGRRVSGGLGDAGGAGLEGYSRNDTAAQGWKEQDRPASATGVSDAPLPTDSFWKNADWLLCRDGKWRPVEPGAFPLAHGAAGRVGRLRGYGNAIVAPQAEAFIRAFDELTEEQ